MSKLLMGLAAGIGLGTSMGRPWGDAMAFAVALLAIVSMGREAQR
jgi:hypothetical protein